MGSPGRAADRAGPHRRRHGALRQWLERDRESASAHYRLGLVHLKQGDAGRAVPPLRTATQLDPKHFQAWLQLGDAMMALG